MNPPTPDYLMLASIALIELAHQREDAEAECFRLVAEYLLNLSSANALRNQDAIKSPAPSERDASTMCVPHAMPDR